jgi:hypothetical protein
MQQVRSVHQEWCCGSLEVGANRRCINAIQFPPAKTRSRKVLWQLSDGCSRRNTLCACGNELSIAKSCVLVRLTVVHRGLPALQVRSRWR